MQTLNRAIEDASDFREFQRKLLEVSEDQRAEVHALQGQKRPGETRKQFRERLRREQKAAVKT